MTGEHDEGWYTDPFARHEQRWMSDGKPTKLARDGGKTSYDDPPGGPFVQDPEEVEPTQTPSNDELQRADEAESDDDPEHTRITTVSAVFATLNLLKVDKKSNH